MYEEQEVVDGFCCHCFKPIPHLDDEIFPLCKQCEYDWLMGRLSPYSKDKISYEGREI